MGGYYVVYGICCDLVTFAVFVQAIHNQGALHSSY